MYIIYFIDTFSLIYTKTCTSPIWSRGHCDAQNTSIRGRIEKAPPRDRNDAPSLLVSALSSSFLLQRSELFQKGLRRYKLAAAINDIVNLLVQISVLRIRSRPNDKSNNFSHRSAGDLANFR